MNQQDNTSSTELIELAMVGKLALDIIHELSNSVQIISGFTQNLIDSDSDPDSQQEDLNIIQEESLRCAEVIKNLRLVNRPQQGNFSQSLLFVFDDIYPFLSMYLKKKSITMEKNIPEDLSYIVGNTNKIRIGILMALISAIERCNKDQTILVQAQEDKNHVVVKIESPTSDSPETSYVLFGSHHFKQLDIHLRDSFRETTWVQKLKFKKEYE